MEENITEWDCFGLLLAVWIRLSADFSDPRSTFKFTVWCLKKEHSLDAVFLIVPLALTVVFVSVLVK